MGDSEKVQEYLKKYSQWTDQLLILRAVFLKTELKEKIKWGAPAYTLNGIIVSGLGAFKKSLCHLVSSRCLFERPRKTISQCSRRKN